METSAAAADDSRQWHSHIKQWACDYFDSDDVSATKVVPQTDAQFTFQVKWPLGVFNTAPHRRVFNLEHIGHSLRTTLGPLTYVSSASDLDRYIHVSVHPMPRPVIESVKRNIHRTLNTALWRAPEASTRFHVLVWLGALANLAASVVLLHNHWYAYDEPWNGVVEFVTYHVFGSHRHH